MSSSCPPPVYAADTPLSELGTAELLLVTALRLFAVPPATPTGIRPDWRHGFEAAGIGEYGIPAFHGLFAVIGSTASRLFEVRPSCCQVLGCDEGRLLQLMSLLQRREMDSARAILADCLPSSSLRLAIGPARGLARVMARAGLTVPWRHAEAGKSHRILAFNADRGLMLVQ